MEQQALNPKNDKPPSYSEAIAPQVNHSWQPPPGYYPSPGVSAQNSSVPYYGATTIIVVGACPACRVGVLEDDYTCLGLFCAIFFFPLGILCCLLLKNRRCSNCRLYFS